MPATQFEAQGTLRPDGTLVLDQKPDLPPGRVQVVLRALPQPAAPAESLMEFVGRVRREAEAQGSHFMNDAEVTAWVEQLRDEEDRVEEAYRRRDEERRRREQPGC